MKCAKGARAGRYPATDCQAPLVGEVAACVARAKGKARAALDPAKCRCPECYADGDCVAFASALTEAIAEGVVDLAALALCDDSGSPNGLDRQERKCEDVVARALAKYVATALGCLKRCRRQEFKDAVPLGSCQAPAPSDEQTVACVQRARHEASGAIFRQCAFFGQGGRPPQCHPGDDIPFWLGQGEDAIEATGGAVFCGSPSPAFLDPEPAA